MCGEGGGFYLCIFTESEPVNTSQWLQLEEPTSGKKKHLIYIISLNQQAWTVNMASLEPTKLVQPVMGWSARPGTLPASDMEHITSA